jgi:hypothetical protein
MEGDNITRKKKRKPRGSPINTKGNLHNKVFKDKKGSF